MCRQVEREECYNVPRQVPREECNQVPRQECQNVPKRQPKEVCNQVKTAVRKTMSKKKIVLKFS